MAKGSVSKFTDATKHIKLRGVSKPAMPKQAPTGPKKVNSVPGNTKIKGNY